ncbi:MAG: type I pullulanase, partial [Clostridia bacterium]|nr:type I pullulanase [Clostridia bacterium]
TYDANSNFTKIVPYYYYRYDSSGMLSNGSGCGNETASERAMFRKFMVDSVKYWASEYHIDGFRFDLMALHDTETMQQIEAAVHGINPHAIIYGEGWTGGTTTLTSGKQANQANIKTITPTEPGIGAVAVFNDAIRDGLKGSVFDAKDTGYINGTVNKSNASKVVFGITGGLLTPGVGWNVPDNAVVNYMACHDNNTLWDKLLISNPDNTDAERLQMNRFGTSIIMMSKGIPFFLAGEEILRTKDGDHNSYNSSDEINNIDWDSLKEGSPEMEMRDFYRALISMRKANGFFTEAAVFCEINPDNSITVRWEREGELLAHAFINPTASQIPFTLPETGTWYPLLMDEKAVTEAEPVEGTVNVAPGTVFIAVLVP